MKIALTATGKSLDSNIDPRFGRAQVFLLVDTATMSVEVVENKQNLDLPQGAGIQAAQTIASHKTDVLVTGNCGPKAFKVLKAAGIKVVIGVTGRAEDVVERYKNGELQPTTDANVEGHWV